MSTEQQKQLQRESYARNKTNRKWMAHRQKMQQAWSKRNGYRVQKRHRATRNKNERFRRLLASADKILKTKI